MRSAARHPSLSAPWRWLAAGSLMGLLIALVVWAPARWLASAVLQASSQRLSLQDARGTVWKGSARWVLTGGQGSQDQQALPGRVSWQLRPAWSGLHLALTADCCTAQPIGITATLSPGGTVEVAVQDGLSSWPASLLTGLGTPWNTIAPEGQLQFSTRAATLTWAAGRLAMAGQAQIDALGVSSRLSTLRPMGSYRITLQGGASPALNVSTLEGSLQLSGQGQWVGARLRFTGEAVATPDRQEALANLLNILGRRMGERSIIKLG
ncbi:MAG: hypothetical protein RJA34_1774 [Pseudomonadota bacterium]